MIPATTLHHATFRHTDLDGRPTERDEPVIAWDEEGHALVLNNNRLVRAKTLRGFVAVTWEEIGPVVGIASVDGWVAEFLSSEDRQTTLPLAGMAIRSTGEAFPLVIYPDGRCDDPQGDRTFKRIYHPGQDTEPPTEP